MKGGHIMDLLLFTMPNCGQCLISKRKLDKAELTYTEIDVTKSEENSELARSYNVVMAGTIIDKETGLEYTIQDK